jgi:hypothetical protein
MIKSWLSVIVTSLLTCLLTPIGIGEPADEPETWIMHTPSMGRRWSSAIDL